MKGIRIAALSFCLGVLSLPFVQKTHADEWDKKTNVTFNEPVEVPGVVLPAGSYVFKLADSESDRHIARSSARTKGTYMPLSWPFTTSA
jgi:hypothetical protein